MIASAVIYLLEGKLITLELLPYLIRFLGVVQIIKEPMDLGISLPCWHVQTLVTEIELKDVYYRD